jgi:mRNA-degrading endonuclease toxin of MazEF toxin-antitoxin module
LERKGLTRTKPCRVVFPARDIYDSITGIYCVAIGMIKKDFDAWNEIKKDIDDFGKSKFYNVRELWWCTLGLNVGSEQDGSGDNCRRPVLVLRGLSADTCLIVPLTTSAHKHPMRPSIGTVEDKEAHALLSQMRVIDTKRLVRKIGRLDKNIFKNIRKAAKDML